MTTAGQDPVARVRVTFEAVADDDDDQSGVPFFGPAADGLLEALAPQPGERALDMEGWTAFSMSTGQRAMWPLVPEAERDGLLARAADILDGARDGTGRVVSRQDMRYTLGSASDRA